MSMAKHWCFTLFEENCLFQEDERLEYCTYGREVCPVTGKPHLQGYLCLKKKARLSFMKKLHPSCHWEIKRGTVKEAIDYCRKDGKWEQFGDIPDESGSQSSYRHCVELAQAGKMDSIAEEYPGMYTRYKRTYESMVQFSKEPLEEPCGIWIVGPPGCGKDGNVIKKYSPFVKPHNKWWDGYSGQEVVLISDVDKSDAKWIGNFLKIWTDRYPFRAEIKSGTIQIRPKKIFVTSNYLIKELFEDVTMSDALDRRFEIIEYYGQVTKTKRPKIELDPTLENEI